MYDKNFYKSQAGGSSRSADIIVPVVMNLVHPRSVVDVGCGVGTWLRSFCSNGVQEILGIDGEWVDREQLHIPKQHFISMDLSQARLLHQRKFDLAISLEVAEHLPPESAPTFVEFITSFAPIVMFSAAIPGQGGAHHVNEQWPHYWFELFSQTGYRVIDCIRPRIWNQIGIRPWYAQNIFLYVNEEQFDHYNQLLTSDLSFRMPTHLNMVHPGLFAEAIARPATGPEMLKEAFRRCVVRLQRTLGSITRH